MDSVSKSCGSDPIREDLHRELAFLRYRRTVVSRWPEAPLKAAALAGIESRITLLHSSDSCSSGN
jgi:hypothetical protein